MLSILYIVMHIPDKGFVLADGLFHIESAQEVSRKESGALLQACTVVQNLLLSSMWYSARKLGKLLEKYGKNPTN
jgi:hypothetical protein